MAKRVEIVIVDDQDLFIEGLKMLLAEHVEILGTAKNGYEALTILLENKPQLLLLDINMPELDGIDACRMIKKKYPSIKILILSSYSNKEFIADVMHNGADGYLLKNAGKQELVEAIETVAAGDRYVSPQLRIGKEALSKQLTKRELYILRLIGRGFTAPEIAEELFLSVHTVETHRRNILAKLELKNKSLLVKYAVERGLT